MTYLVVLLVTGLLQTPSAQQEAMTLDQARALFADSNLAKNLPAPLATFFEARRGKGFQARFQEEKRVAILKRPLKSGGRIIFLPSHGLYRRLEKPLQQEMVITADMLYRRDALGGERRMPMGKEPVAKAFVSAFLSLFAGKWSEMERHFKVYFSQQEDGWRLGLAPKHFILGKLIDGIVLEGNERELTSLWVLETSGDHTESRFSEAEYLAEVDWQQWTSYFDIKPDNP